MNIVLGLTGSVATILYAKLIEQCKTFGNTKVIMTASAEHFVDLEKIRSLTWCEKPNPHYHKLGVFSDVNEWSWQPDAPVGWNDKRTTWRKDDSILHIDLCANGSALVIAPCSANTLGKLANGLCDNLLTTVARAWDLNRPIIVAPAMNTRMWEHPATEMHLEALRDFGYSIVYPQTKQLACGTTGVGAMADIDNITKEMKRRLQWWFPLQSSYNSRGSYVCPGIPTGSHPGSFLKVRTHHTHTGVDLYTIDGHSVYAAEAGKIVGIEDFTGVKQESPWWEDTQCMLIEGATGVICYGEITPCQFRKIGDNVERGEYIGEVKRVLPVGRERPDIPGHSLSMLHMEIYPHGKYKAFEERGPTPDSFDILVDPTPYLLEAEHAPVTKLT